MTTTEKLREGVIYQLDTLFILSDKDLRLKVALGVNYDIDWDALESEEDTAIYTSVVGVSCYLAGVCDALNCHRAQLFKMLAIDLDKFLDEE